MATARGAITSVLDADGKRCLAAFLLGYLLAEAGVSITALFL